MFNYLYRLALKRAFDILGGLCLLLLLATLYLPIAWLIKRSSPGRVIIWQKRVGKDEIPFLMPKFRTMVFDDQSGAPDKMVRCEKTNPDVTGIGRFLRKSKLDELPQSLLVLTGTMSLVGYRPVLVALHERYMQKSNGQYRLRNQGVKPGLLGPASANGPEHLSDEGWRRQLEDDLKYRLQMSFWIDLKSIWANLANRLGGKVTVFTENRTPETCAV